MAQLFQNNEPLKILYKTSVFSAWEEIQRGTISQVEDFMFLADSKNFTDRPLN